MAFVFKNIFFLAFLVPIGFFANGSAYGQLSQEDTTILLQIIRKVSSKTPIVYVDSGGAIKLELDERIKIIQKGEFFDWRKELKLKLTRGERKYLIKQLKMKVVWPANLFPNSRCVTPQGMYDYFYELNKQRASLLQPPVSDTNLRKYRHFEYHYVFLFEKPIYLRNNTLCLLSYVALCGNTCGHEATVFYKKVNDRWEKLVSVSGGDF